MKRMNLFGVTACILLACFLLASFVSISFLSKVINENEKEMTYNLTSQVYGDISETLSAPIMVARTMSNDLYLQRLLSEPDFPQNKSQENDVIEYLNLLCTGLNYNTSFLISHLNGRYYTPLGFNKVVKPGEDEHDIWYSNFINSGLLYDFDVDTDETHKNNWTVFVNCRVQDKNNNLLGVCGVGVDMQFLQEKLKKFELKNNVKINLVDKNGLVQIDTDSINIEAAVLEEAMADFTENDQYTYRRSATGGYIVTKYVNQFNWYLVVTKEGTDHSLYIKMISMLLLAFIFIFIVVTIILLLVMRSERRVLEHKAKYDALAGVYNKQIFLYYLNKRRKTDRNIPFAFLFIDLDNFKDVNDILGHAAGDKAIKATASVLKNFFRAGDLVGRFGGDEFVVYLKNFPEKDLLVRADKILEQLRTTYGEGEKSVSVSASIGIVYASEGSEISGPELLELADKELYKAKTAGRNQYKINKI